MAKNSSKRNANSKSKPKRERKPPPRPEDEGETLKGHQLSKMNLIWNYFVSSTLSFLLVFAYRKNANGTFVPIFLPSSLFDSNGSERSVACCWDIHVFLFSRSQFVQPFLSIPTKFYQLGSVTMERHRDSCYLRYLTATWIRGNKAQLGDASHRVSYGIKQDIGSMIDMGSFLFHPITTNATSYSGKVDRQHFLSQPACMVAFETDPFVDHQCVPLSPTSQAALHTTLPTILKHISGLANIIDVHRVINEWFEPRQYGPGPRQTITPRPVEYDRLPYSIRRFATASVQYKRNSLPAPAVTHVPTVLPVKVESLLMVPEQNVIVSDDEEEEEDTTQVIPVISAGQFGFDSEALANYVPNGKKRMRDDCSSVVWEEEIDGSANRKRLCTPANWDYQSDVDYWTLSSLDQFQPSDDDQEQSDDQSYQSDDQSYQSDDQFSQLNDSTLQPFQHDLIIHAQFSPVFNSNAYYQPHQSSLFDHASYQTFQPDLFSQFSQFGQFGRY